MPILYKTVVARGMIVGTSLVSACATVPRNAGFPDVQTLVTARAPTTGQLVWQANPDTSAVVLRSGAVDTLLARGLTPASAVAVALVQNPRIQATYARLGVARADVIDARIAPNPFVDVAALRAGAVSVLELNVTHALFSVFQIPRRRRVAEAAFTATKLSVAQAVLDLMAQTRTAYYAAVATEQQLEVDSTIASATALGAEFAQRQHDAGNVTDLDLAAQQALAAQTRIDLLRTRQERVDAREDLSVVLGVAANDPAGQPLWRTRTRLPDPPVTEPSLTDAERTALTQRLDLAAARADITATGAALGLTGLATLIPDVTVGVRTERDAEGATARGPIVGLPIPLFDRGQGSRARAIAHLNAARAQYVALALDVRSQVRRTRATVLTARERALTLRDVVLPLRHRVVEQTQLEYNGMLVGIYQLLQAKRDEIAAARDYVLALREYWTARAALDAAVGGAFDHGASDAAFDAQDRTAAPSNAVPTPPSDSTSGSPHDTSHPKH